MLTEGKNEEEENDMKTGPLQINASQSYLGRDFRLKFQLKGEGQSTKENLRKQKWPLTEKSHVECVCMYIHRPARGSKRR